MSTIEFPSPIGGVPFNLDFIPSLVFAGAYAIAVAGAVYRLIRSSSRTLTIIGTLIFCTERIVIFLLRAKQAKTPSEDNSSFLTQYWQLSFSIGYLTVFADLCLLMRALFVKTTIGGESAIAHTALLTDEGEQSGVAMSGYNSLEEDRPQERQRYRKYFTIIKLTNFLPILLGVVAGAIYVPAEKNSSKANLEQTLRYATTLVGFSLITQLQVLSLHGYFTNPRIRKSSALLAFIMASLLNITSIYRLNVMRFHTTSLTSMAPGSLNSPGSKATFYIFHAAPDFLAAAIMLTINVRERFSTGLWGDRTPKKGKS